MTKSKVAIAAITGSIAMVLGLGIAPATAATTTTTTTAGMYASGFDTKVAEAHGFKTETVGGVTKSVPVTDAAKALAAAFRPTSSLRGVHPNGTGVSYGPCGTSTITAIYSSGHATVTTAYSVYTIAGSQTWSVTVNLDSGSFYQTLNFSGLNNAPTWRGAPQRTSGSNTHVLGGHALVSPGSFAILIDGTICFSGSPVAVIN